MYGWGGSDLGIFGNLHSRCVGVWAWLCRCVVVGKENVDLIRGLNKRRRRQNQSLEAQG